MRHPVWMAGVVMGVDGCSRGWVDVLLAGDGVEALFAPTIGELAEAARGYGEFVVMAVDIPVGLPDAGARRADVMAQRRVGSRSSSVFSSPVHGAVRLDSYERAAEIQRRAAGSGLSRQAFGLRAKILEVDAWLPSASCRVVEVHPEVSFAELAGCPLSYGKSTWAGVEYRRGLLEGVGLRLASDLGVAGQRAGVDDVLDAAVAAWTARRVRDGIARSLPDPPEVFGDGLAAAIWY